jgi:acyl carrier protein
MKESILTYISEKLLDNEFNITYDTPLYSSSVLTSMGHLKLVNYLERTYEISIPMSKVNLDNFDSINMIVDFINNEITNKSKEVSI